ncbi:glutamate-gated chloride channel alpha-like [Tigriopus californicus]|uniref:glutamate-gated chloride channel alpha-like n=1 Tax=Tigriopus californicus TaxID=6832 RepID=UPI0027D9F326|nr:glutamate-gated chloride channel alpha-like [Tigriopus californicus]
MDFNQFPFDKHTCNLQVGVDLPTSEVDIKSLQSENDLLATTISSKLEYSIRFGPLPQENQFSVTHALHKSNGSVQSQTGFQIHLERKMSTYIFNYYLPSGLFVIVSWMSYVIPPDSIPARITLIITTFLVLVNIATTAFSKFPISSEINPIQLWIMACLAFVFSTIIQFALILAYQRKVIRHTFVTRWKIKKQGICMRPMRDDMLGISELKMMILLMKIDGMCLTGSLVLFFAFNVYYWLY